MQKEQIANYPMVNPTPIVLVGTELEGRANFTTVGAFGVVCLKPIYYVSLKNSHRSTAGVRESGFFSVNLPSADMVQMTDYCGMVSGSDVDKSALFDVFYNERGKAPMIKESPMNYLCKVVDQHEIEGFTVFFGEIIATFVNENCMTDGKPDPLKINPCLTMGITYYSLGHPIGKVFQDGSHYRRKGSLIHMQIIVKKPTEAEKQSMQRQPIWTCGVSEFDWYYDSEEIKTV